VNRVLVVDDHRMFAESLVRVLGDEPDIEVTGIAVSAADATAQIAEYQPDVCVLDYQLPDQDGATAVPSQVEVLRLLAEGTSTEDVMTRRFVSRHTVRTHVHKVIGKLGAHSKLEAVAPARREGIV
jgi:DNA-binding NarL/FixJ family response regulator